MHLTRRGLAAAAGLCAARAASAQQADWPSRPIQFVVAAGPGDATDVIGRLLQPSLSARLGQPLVVINRAGAAGNIGAAFVSRAAPDGYTLYMASGSTLIFNPHTYRDLGFDPDTSFTPIARTTAGGLVVGVRAASGIADLRGLLDHLRKRGEAASFGASGTGTSVHVAGEMLLREAGLAVQHIPYRTDAQAAAGLASGEVDFAVNSRGASSPLIQGGEIRPVAVTGSRRDPMFPDVPTMAERWPGAVVDTLTGIAGPAGLPPSIVARVQEATRVALEDPDILSKLRLVSAGAAYQPAAEFGPTLAAERRRFGEVVRGLGIKPA
jgi:tripartite-type tricarboxylate transporter receptor subunit TctC